MCLDSRQYNRCSTSKMPTSSLVMLLKGRAKPAVPKTPEPSYDAAHKAIETYELLEHILTYADPPTLRSARLVNHFWLSIITKNRILNKRYKPEPPKRYTRVLHFAICGLDHNEVRDFLDHWVTPDCYFLGYDPTLEEAWRRVVHAGKERYCASLEPVSRVGAGGGYEEALMEVALRDSDGYVLVYSIDSRDSFNAIVELQARLSDPDSELRERIARHRARSRPHLAVGPDPDPPRPWLTGLVATRCEGLPEFFQVASSEVEDLAKRLGCPFWGVSCTLKEGLKESLQGVVEEYLALPGRWGEEREREARVEAARLEKERKALRYKRFWRRSSWVS